MSQPNSKSFNSGCSSATTTHSNHRSSLSLEDNSNKEEQKDSVTHNLLLLSQASMSSMKIDVPPQASVSHQKTAFTTTHAPPTTTTTKQTTSFQQGCTSHQNNDDEGSSLGTSHQNTHQAARYSSHQDYNLGDTCRSPHHMIVEPNRSKATQAVDTLSNHDFAFVKRSGGRYTYAILAYRTKGTCKGVQQEEHNSISFSSLSISPRESEEEEKEETMTFVLKDDGCDKVIKKSQWADNVRLISNATTSSTAASSNIERSEKAMITILPPAKLCAMKEDAPPHHTL